MEAFFENQGLIHIGLQILGYQDPKTLGNCRLVNRTWCRLITEERLWAVARLDFLKVKAELYGPSSSNGIKWKFWSKFVKKAKEEQSKKVLRKIFNFLDHQLNLTVEIWRNVDAIFYDPWIGMERLLINGEIEFAKMLLQWLKENGSFQLLPKRYTDIDITTMKTSEFGLFAGCYLGLEKLTKLFLSDPLEESINANKPIEGHLPFIAISCYHGPKTQVTTKVKVVEALLQIPDLDVNAVDSKGCSALHWSATFDDIEAMTKLLARKDIKVNASATINGITGTTPLHLVFRNLANVPDKLSKALLKAKGIDVNAVDGQGMIPRNYLRGPKRLASQKAKASIKLSLASTTKRRRI